MPQPTSTHPTPLELAATLTEQALLARATELARSGDYAAADVLLDELVASGHESAPALDLAARMAAQQGKLAQAKALWQRALELAPGEEAYRAGFQRVLAVQRQPLLGRLLILHPWRGVVLLVVLLMICISIVQTWRTVHLQSTLNAVQATSASRLALLSLPTMTPVPSPTAMPTLLPTNVPTLQPTAAPTAIPLAEKAQALLDSAQDKLGASIRAAERAGVVYLTGQVPSFSAFDTAVKQMRSIAGVVSVNSDALSIVPPELATAVEQALAGQADGLTFQVLGTGVQLSGMVYGDEALHTALLAVKAVPGVTWVDSTQVVVESLYRSYTVNEGDSLASIALAELGDTDSWPAIFELNRDLIAEPSLIRPGMVLKLPRK